MALRLLVAGNCPMPMKGIVARNLTAIQTPRVACLVRWSSSDSNTSHLANSNSSVIPANNGSSESLTTTQVPSYKIARVAMDGTISESTLQTQEILRKSSIYARDLFSLSLTSRHAQMRKGLDRRSITAILPRGKEILLSFGNIRALVGKESVMIFDADNLTVQQFAHDVADSMQEHYRASEKPAIATTDDPCTTSYSEQPFELSFLEEVLRETCDAFNRRTHLYEPIVDKFLDRVSNEVFSDSGVHHLVPIKDSLQSFEMQVRQCLECLTALLDNDDDMLGLLLTEQSKADAVGEFVPYERHEDVELLLEEYARQLNNILFEINYLLQRLQSKQEFVSLALAGYRNRLIRMNLYLGVGGLSLGIGTTIAGFFGMNLISGLETSPVAFNNVVMFTSITSLLVAGGCASYVSGRTMQHRAKRRLEEIETLNGALSDMCALDYTVKKVMGSGKRMEKQEFGERLRKARSSGEVTEEEVNLLFDLMDTSGDGKLASNDFPTVRKNPRCPPNNLN